MCQRFKISTSTQKNIYKEIPPRGFVVNVPKTKDKRRNCKNSRKIKPKSNNNNNNQLFYRKKRKPEDTVATLLRAIIK